MNNDFSHSESDDSNEEVLHLLPGTITDVVSVSPTSKRLLIKVDRQPFVELSTLFLRDCPVKEGDSIDRTLGEHLLALKRQEEVFNYGLRALGRRNHTSKELHIKARQKGYQDGDIGPAIRRLEERGLIDEQAFARFFAEQKLSRGDWGPSKIRAALMDKGVSETIVDEVLQKLDSQTDWLELMRRQVGKKKRRFLKEADMSRRRKKMFDYLSRKGYHREQIWQHLDQLMNELDNE